MRGNSSGGTSAARKGATGRIRRWRPSPASPGNCGRAGRIGPRRRERCTEGGGRPGNGRSPARRHSSDSGRRCVSRLKACSECCARRWLDGRPRGGRFLRPALLCARQRREAHSPAAGGPQSPRGAGRVLRLTRRISSRLTSRPERWASKPPGGRGAAGACGSLAGTGPPRASPPRTSLCSAHDTHRVYAMATGWPAQWRSFHRRGSQRRPGARAPHRRGRAQLISSLVMQPPIAISATDGWRRTLAQDLPRRTFTGRTRRFSSKRRPARAAVVVFTSGNQQNLRDRWTMGKMLQAISCAERSRYHGDPMSTGRGRRHGG
jgi:hypothetical protein